MVLCLVGVGVSISGFQDRMLAAACFIAILLLISYDARRGGHEKKISLTLRYAWHFDNYLGSRPGDDETRKIQATKPLKKKFVPNDAVPLVLGVANENEGLPLEDAWLHANFLDDGLTVAHGGKWAVQVANRRYSYRFLGPITNTWVNTDAPLSVKFPRPGRYSIVCYIDGRGIRMVEKPFWVVLYE